MDVRSGGRSEKTSGLKGGDEYKDQATFRTRGVRRVRWVGGDGRERQGDRERPRGWKTTNKAVKTESGGPLAPNTQPSNGGRVGGGEEGTLCTQPRQAHGLGEQRLAQPAEEVIFLAVAVLAGALNSRSRRNRNAGCVCPTQTEPLSHWQKRPG